MTFILKLTLVPLFLGIVSLAGRVYGHAVSGWLAALPIIAGPIVFILTLERGVGFGAQASLGTLLGLIGLSTFCLSYAYLAKRASWPVSLFLSWIGFGLLTLVLSYVELSLWLALLLVLIYFFFVLKVFPAEEQTAGSSKPPNWEIVLRMVFACLLVVLITALAETLGPRLSGLLAPFPIAAAILGVFSHSFHGADSVILLMRGFVIGLFSYAFFFALVAMMLESQGVALTFFAASVLALTMHFFTSTLVSRSSGRD